MCPRLVLVLTAIYPHTWGHISTHTPPAQPTGKPAPPGRAIIVLESNIGYTELHSLLVAAGDRSKVCLDCTDDYAVHVWHMRMRRGRGRARVQHGKGSTVKLQRRWQRRGGRRSCCTLIQDFCEGWLSVGGLRCRMP